MARAATTKKDETKPASAPVPVQREQRYPLSDLRSEMERVFDRVFERFPSFSLGRDLTDWEPFGRLDRTFGTSAPRVDISETDKAYQVVAELPGLDQNDIEVELKDDVLTVSGDKKEEKEREEKNYHVSERRFGSFRRSFRIPGEVDQNKISAEFKNGVLTVALPKTAKAQKPSKKIGIKAK